LKPWTPDLPHEKLEFQPAKMACLWISPRNPWGLIVDLKFIIAKLVEISIKYGLYLYGRALLALMTLILSGGFDIGM